MTSKTVVTGTIDVTPTWRGLLPAMVAVLTDHERTPAGWQARRRIEEQLARMADAADLWNEAVRGGLLATDYELSQRDEHICERGMCEHDPDDGQFEDEEQA